MAYQELESSKLASEAARKTAARHGEAISRYGELLKTYSEGELEPSDLVRGGTQLFIRESYSLVEDAMRMSALYWQWVAEVMGTTVKKTSSPSHGKTS
jgi:hypothetical protein